MGDEHDRDAILERRKRLLSSALSGVALSAFGIGAQACACLSFQEDAGPEMSDAGPMDSGWGDAGQADAAADDAATSDAGEVDAGEADAAADAASDDGGAPDGAP